MSRTSNLPQSRWVHLQVKEKKLWKGRAKLVGSLSMNPQENVKVYQQVATRGNMRPQTTTLFGGVLVKWDIMLSPYKAQIAMWGWRNSPSVCPGCTSPKSLFLLGRFAFNKQLVPKDQKHSWVLYIIQLKLCFQARCQQLTVHNKDVLWTCCILVHSMEVKRHIKTV